MNDRVIPLTIFIILGMIIAPTIYKTHKLHQNDLMRVVEKEMEYQSIYCYKEDNCTNIVTLKDLYDNNYLTEKLVNPNTKKYYSEESFINLDTKEIKLIS